MTFPGIRTLSRAGLLAFFTLGLQSCLGNSWLTDAGRFIQPGWVRVSLDVIKERDLSDGTLRASLEARFYDKDDQRIEFEGGDVYVNDMRMNRHTALFAPFYRLSGGSIRFVHDTTYVFRIVIDRRSTRAYICSVRTPKGDLEEILVNGLGDSAAVRWIGDSTLPLRLEYELSGRGDASGSVSRGVTFAPPHVGVVKIDKEGYWNFVLKKMETVTSGTVDPAFRGGTIEALVRLVP